MGWRDFLGRRGRRPATYKTPAEGDSLILAQLRSLGADLSRPREVLQFLYFPSEDAATEAAEALRGYGYRVEVNAPDDDTRGLANPWSVVATGEFVVDEQWVDAMRPQLQAIASLGGGAYDGWEAAAG